jgi:hypothetical protein
MKRLPAVLLILGIAVVLGSLRDFLLINLNYQLDHVQRATPSSYAHSGFQAVVGSWGLKALTTLKWGLAIGFVAATWALCQGTLSVFGLRQRLGRLVTHGFLGIATLALVAHLLARGIPLLEPVSVDLLHAIQYPVVVLLLLVVLLLFEGRSKPAA